jgi:hypothetical protein
MSGPLAVATALTFVWLGMVLGISFLEAPLKFRAPGVSLPIGLAIGRLVFRALNALEVLLAVGVGVLLVSGDHPGRVWGALVLAAAPLAVQVLMVRPRLSRRTDRVLAGEHPPRSRAHHAYVGLELVKVAGLLVLGTFLLSS